MAEIQSRLDSMFPRETPKVGEFEAALGGRPAGLSGSIGGPSSGNVPVNPMAGGLELNPTGSAAMYRPYIEQAANEAGVDADLLDALVMQESGYNPLARSKAGAVGLTQLMEDTAKGLGVADRTDPVQSLRGGAKYLSQMLHRFGGDVKLALAAYNAGPGAVEKFSGIPPYSETQRYVDRVASNYYMRKGR